MQNSAYLYHFPPGHVLVNKPNWPCGFPLQPELPNKLGPICGFPDKDDLEIIMLSTKLGKKIKG